MGLGPVIPDEQHAVSLRSSTVSPEFRLAAAFDELQLAI
jgi:hypothetical protein